MKEKQTMHEGFIESLIEQIQYYDGEKKEIILLAPELFKLMTNLLKDERTPPEAQSLINGAIAYFVAPYDGLPEEVHGPLGFMDDIFVCLYVLKKLMNFVDWELLIENWEGVESIRTVVDNVYPEVKEYVRGAAEHIVNYVDFMISG